MPTNQPRADSWLLERLLSAESWEKAVVALPEASSPEEFKAPHTPPISAKEEKKTHAVQNFLDHDLTHRNQADGPT